MFGRLLGCYTAYTFSGASCRLTEFCHAQNARYVQVLRSPILAALLRGTSAPGRLNLLPILLRFRDIVFDRSKIDIFGYPSCV